MLFFDVSCNCLDKENLVFDYIIKKEQSRSRETMEFAFTPFFCTETRELGEQPSNNIWEQVYEINRIINMEPTSMILTFFSIFFFFNCNIVHFRFWNEDKQILKGQRSYLEHKKCPIFRTEKRFLSCTTILWYCMFFSCHSFMFIII